LIFLSRSCWFGQGSQRPALRPGAPCLGGDDERDRRDDAAEDLKRGLQRDVGDGDAGEDGRDGQRAERDHEERRHDRVTDRLIRLVDEGILERVRYSERPERFEYRLKPKGLELNVALTALRQWGDKHLSEKPPRLLRRKADRKPVIAALVPKGTPVLRPQEVETVPGPGWS
jgi:hypothetical protein